MTAHAFTESEVEVAALEWFSRLGYAVMSGPDIAPRDTRRVPGLCCTVAAGSRQDAVSAHENRPLRTFYKTAVRVFI